MTDKLDVYSDMRIPFTVAAFCRQRRYHPDSVALAKCMRADSALRQQIETLQEQLETNTQVIKAAVGKVEVEMERSNAN